MKASELMIGDWVKLSKGNWFENRKVELIDIEMIAESVYLAEPIPLTPKILEKNGWMKIAVDGVFYPKQLKGELPWIGYATNEDSWRFRIRDFCEINYVHELQHALRLCGIEKEIEI